MALVSRPVEVPVPCPSPARVGSTGTIHYLLQKERPVMDQQANVNRGSVGVTAKSSKEFVHVCREVVSVSCGQPLLSYKPKRSKSLPKVVKTSESKATSKITVESSPRSLSNRSVPSVVRLAGTSDVIPISEVRRGDPVLKETTSARAKCAELPGTRKPLSHGDSSEIEVGKIPAPSVLLEPEDVHRGEYPVFQMSNSSLGSRPLPEDYHKALIPFLRAEWDASAKILKRRQCNQAPKKGVHRRSTSLGSSCTTFSPTTDQKAWQSYTRDSYPPFSTSKKHSFFRLTSGENS